MEVCVCFFVFCLSLMLAGKNSLLYTEVFVIKNMSYVDNILSDKRC